MDKPGPPRPKAKGKELQASLDDEPTAVALPESAEATTRASSPAGSDLEVTVADPVNDLLATTEMPTVREGFAAPEEQAVEEDDPNKAYFAPQAIPTPAIPDNEDSRRVVLNLPDQGAVLPPSPQDVDRARRRAPTVKIPRATLAARGTVPAEVALPPPPPPAPPAPVLATPTEDPPEERAESPLLSLPVNPRESSERRAEPPPTARHVSEPPQRSRSRMPLIALAALCIGGGVFAVFSLGGSRDAAKVSDATAPAGAKPEPEKAAAAPSPAATTPVERPVAVTPPVETAAPAITLTADPIPPPTQQTMAGAAAPPKASPPAAAPTTPPRPATPASLPATAPPRPPVAAPPKPPMKPGDYTPPTI